MILVRQVVLPLVMEHAHRLARSLAVRAVQVAVPPVVLVLVPIVVLVLTTYL